MKVLDECNEADPDKASILIERKYNTWGDLNCMEMAAAAGDKVGMEGQKKLIISFSGQFFSKINEAAAGRLYFLYFYCFRSE